MKIELIFCDTCGTTENVIDVFDGHKCENCIELEEENETNSNDPNSIFHLQTELQSQIFENNL